MTFKNNPFFTSHAIVAAAQETLIDPNGEIDGCFAWAIYDEEGHSLHLARIDNNAGTLRSIVEWDYNNAHTYAKAFRCAMQSLYTYATGFDFDTAAPRR